MKRFVWRLQKVLDIKRQEEQTKTVELMKLTEKLAQARGELVSRQMVLRNILATIARQEPQKRLCEQEFFLRCSAVSDEQIKKLKEKMSELESQQRKKIAEVLKVRRFKEGLERLRAESKRRFIQEQEKLEQKELDETGRISFVRARIKSEAALCD